MDLIDIGLFASYLLIIVCALAAVVLPLAQALGDPQSLIKSGIGVGVVLVIFLVSYLIADPNTPGVSTGISKTVGGGIITTYIFIFAAIGGIIYTEFSKMIK